MDEVVGMVEVDLGRQFRDALVAAARPCFVEDPSLTATLAQLHAVATAALPEVVVPPTVLAVELARRLGDAASPEALAHTHVIHVYLAIACAAGDRAAIRRLDAEILIEVDATARRLRARPDQADEVRGHLRRVLFVSEPGRPAALATFAGRGDLRSYVRVMATRELVRVVGRGRREVGVVDDALLDLLAPGTNPELGYLRDHYRLDVDAAVRAGFARLPEPARALLRYSVLDGWSVDRIGALYGVHRATAARRVAAARDELGAAIRAELARRLAIRPDEVDSIIRLVQSRLDISLERLLG